MGEPVTETYPDLISLCKAAQERGATMVRPDPSEDDFNTVWFYSWNVCYGHAVMGLRNWRVDWEGSFCRQPPEDTISISDLLQRIGVRELPL